ncbi:NifB/NifX family molybdenum-iron cluster-binding protein [Psychromonas sp. PT13]|uniref:NifB/NifX family molybdenum-iron cluster-binding protein n=1 Tax=Psychromonas sp. PT13 TaxID=3439547 RepID=UPI003EB6B56C
MKIAIPLADGLLSMHFGHCGSFAMIDVDNETKQIIAQQEIPSPPHEPGLLPKWLGERKVDMIITGGMGQRAKNLFTEQFIDVIVGANAQAPEIVVKNYLAGSLSSGENACDSDGSECHS